jgi:hypothetical protein
MEIELYSVLSTVILVATVITVGFAIFSYMAFRVRTRTESKQRKKSSLPKEEAQEAPQFFKTYAPSNDR